MVRAQHGLLVGYSHSLRAYLLSAFEPYQQINWNDPVVGSTTILRPTRSLVLQRHRHDDGNRRVGALKKLDLLDRLGTLRIDRQVADLLAP